MSQYAFVVCALFSFVCWLLRPFVPVCCWLVLSFVLFRPRSDFLRALLFGFCRLLFGSVVALLCFALRVVCLFAEEVRLISVSLFRTQQNQNQQIFQPDISNNNNTNRELDSVSEPR